eukprot:1657581-Pyramimonas_sp.AAC.1
MASPTYCRGDPPAHGIEIHHMFRLSVALPCLFHFLFESLDFGHGKLFAFFGGHVFVFNQTHHRAVLIGNEILTPRLVVRPTAKLYE